MRLSVKALFKPKQLPKTLYHKKINMSIHGSQFSIDYNIVGFESVICQKHMNWEITLN